MNPDITFAIVRQSPPKFDVVQSNGALTATVASNFTTRRAAKRFIKRRKRSMR